MVLGTASRLLAQYGVASSESQQQLQFELLWLLAPWTVGVKVKRVASLGSRFDNGCDCKRRRMRARMLPSQLGRRGRTRLASLSAWRVRVSREIMIPCTKADVLNVMGTTDCDLPRTVYKCERGYLSCGICMECRIATKFVKFLRFTVYSWTGLFK